MTTIRDHVEHRMIARKWAIWSLAGRGCPSEGVVVVGLRRLSVEVEGVVAEAVDVLRQVLSLFAHEFGWIDSKRAPDWDGRGCNAEQRHGQHCTAYNQGIARIGLIHNLSQ
jgi:hypothetical protein